MGLHVIPGGRVFPGVGVGVGVGWAVGVGVLGVEGDDPPPQAASAATIAAQRTNETDVLVFNGAPRKRGRRRPRLTNLAGRRPRLPMNCRERLSTLRRPLPGFGQSCRIWGKTVLGQVVWVRSIRPALGLSPATQV